jgi:hypothetical protein
MEQALRIDDYARPRLPWPVKLFNAAGRRFARRIFSLDESALLATASKRERLSDFGPETFREPLRMLLAALDQEARTTALGRYMARTLILQLLATRLRAEDLLTRHPEILDEQIRAPIFVIGLPRTGTTILHNLLSQHSALRTLPYWESLEPIPARQQTTRAVDSESAASPDPRKEHCERALAFLDWMMPLFPRMHEIAAELPHEEIQLLAATFSTMLFETTYQIPSYRDWYKATDQTFAYRYLARLLRILQWLRGPRRWLLKSPQHLEQIPALLEVFPDAYIVRTHRDPVRVVASMATMAAYGLRMQNDGIDPRAVGRYWSDRVHDLLAAAVRHRDAASSAQVLDVRFDEFMRDNAATAETVLAFTGQDVGEPARTAIRRFLALNPRGKHGTIDYRCEDLGLDPKQLRERFRFYQEAFGVVDE